MILVDLAWQFYQYVGDVRAWIQKDALGRLSYCWVLRQTG